MGLFPILSKIIQGKIYIIKPVSEFKKLFGLRLDDSITPALGLLMQNQKFSSHIVQSTGPDFIKVSLLVQIFSEG